VKLRDHGAFTKTGLYGFFLPTYRQAKLIAWDILKCISPRKYLSKRPNESELCVTYRNGSKIRLFGLDKPERILGVKLAGAVIDEYDHVKTNAYDAVIRPALSDSKGFCWFSGSPDCRQKRLKSLCEDVKLKNLQDWSIYKFSSADGGYIDKEEIETARKELDPRTFREQYEATFEDTLGRVYYAFSFDENVSEKAIYNPNIPLRIFWDFNVDPLCVGFAHVYTELDEFRKQVYRIHVFDEIVLSNSNTPEMCRVISEKYGKHKSGMIHYGDATSKARNTASSLSDYQIIYDFFRNQNGISMRFKDSNPAVKDRINAVNSIFLSTDGKRRAIINPKCRNYIKDFLDVSYKDNTCEIDKSNPAQTHASDSFGYFIDYDFPVIRSYIRQ
jgi:hypothetical protein